MYNGNKIKQLLAERNIQNKELLCYLGTEANAALTQIVTGNPTVRRLEKVADFFEVSMDVFFQREKPFTRIAIDEKNRETELLQKIEFLEKLLTEKDKRIDVLESMNQILMNRTNSDNIRTSHI